jgi:hypothetical protein
MRSEFWKGLSTMCRSEVAQLRHQIELELEAMQRAMTGFAAGTARHEFIRRRMDQLGNYQDKLAEHVGESVANQVVCSLYVEIFQ